MPIDPSLAADIARFADELPAAIWVGVVPSGETVYVNQEFREILGFEPPPDAARGDYASSYGVFTRDGHPYPENQMPYERALRARATVVVDDLVIRRGPRPYVYLRVFAKPLFDAAGNITHIVEAFVDITREVDAENARAETEAQLRHAQKMESLGNLAGGIAHDFNNMLGALKLLGSQLAALSLEATASAIVSQMNEVTDSATRLTRALLGFAQRSRSVRKRLSMNRVAEAIVAIARRTVDPRIEIRVEPAREITDVMADESQLEQVIFNLVVNARDATQAPGSITLRTHVERFETPIACGSDFLPAGTYVALDVVDTGGGIPDAIRDRIFEPYFTTKTGGAVRGTGLGLATAYGVVLRHGGGITVAATGPHGTTMRLYLPAALDGDALAKEVPSEPSTVVRGRGTVLLVDDDPVVRQASASALRAIGYDVITAAEGKEAVEIFREHHTEFAAVVLDLVMPVMSGRDALDVMRTIDASVPVLVATGSLLDDAAQSSLGPIAGMLAKPYGPRELTTAVANAIGARAKGV